MCNFCSLLYGGGALWPPMKRRILIGSLSDPNFAKRTAHELISVNCFFFSSLHKINSFLVNRNLFTFIRAWRVMALRRDDIRVAKITTKSRFFEHANFKFYQEIIPKAAKMRRIPTWKQLEGNDNLKKCRANEAWWGILGKLCNHA